MNTPIRLNQEALELLQALEADQPGSLAGLIRIFVADAPALLSRIEVAHARRDPEELKQAAHYLRSASLALGVDALAQAALQIEQLPASAIGSADAELKLGALRTGLRDAVLGLLQVTNEL